MASERLYDTDFYAWTQDQARKLREVRDNRLDAEHLAEEVADLGKSELRAVKAHPAVRPSAEGGVQPGGPAARGLAWRGAPAAHVRRVHTQHAR